MKLKKYIYGVALGALSLSFASCYNADKDFPDFEGGTTAYFAYQYPVRTLVLGNDIYDNTIDNAHTCQWTLSLTKHSAITSISPMKAVTRQSL